jgi:hypothetical protein
LELKKSIAKLLEEGRLREQARINISFGAMTAVQEPLPSPVNLNVLVDQAATEMTWHKLKEIAQKHRVDYSTVWRQLKGKPGFNRSGRTIRVADFLYRSWLESSIRDGLKL